MECPVANAVMICHRQVRINKLRYKLTRNDSVIP